MLGHPYPEQMLEGMSGETFLRWLAFDQLEPFGPRRDDLRMAIQTKWTLQALGAKGRLTIEQFMPRFRVSQKQSVSQIEATLQQWTSAINRHFDERH